MEPVWSASGIGRNGRSRRRMRARAQARAHSRRRARMERSGIGRIERVWSASGIGRVPAPLAAGKKKRNLMRDCANRCSRNRTFNLRIKSPMLCQLSYAPTRRKRTNTPGRIRTCDPRIRSPMLYPAELRVQKKGG